MKPYNPFAESIKRGREIKERMEREKYMRHKKFLECFPFLKNKRNHRHPNAEMI